MTDIDIDQGAEGPTEPDVDEGMEPGPEDEPTEEDPEAPV